MEYQFTFNVSAIAEREEIYNSRLRVYLVNSASVNEGDRIDATLASSGEVISKILLRDTSSQWIEFDDITLSAQSIQEFHIQIDFYPTGNVHRNVHCNSDIFQLVTSIENLDTQPLLIVYSNDPDQSLSEVFQGIEEVEQAEMNIDSTGNQHRVYDRATSTCGVQEAVIEKSTLNGIFTNYQVVLPEKLPLNICGGSCDNTLTITPTHADLLNVYLTQSQIDRTEYKKCCAPLEYTSYDIFTISTTQPRVFQNQRLSNVSVTRCKCQYYKV